MKVSDATDVGAEGWIAPVADSVLKLGHHLAYISGLVIFWFQ